MKLSDALVSLERAKLILAAAREISPNGFTVLADLTAAMTLHAMESAGCGPEHAKAAAMEAYAAFSLKMAQVVAEAKTKANTRGGEAEIG